MLGPIFDREWLTLPRRSRHYLTRATFLGALWVLVLTIWQTTVGWDVPATLGDNARFGMLAFQILASVQLLLVLFFAALSAVSAVAQEKDRRTFVLLLITDLRDHEIVLGKLFGSLLQIVLLIVGSLPLWALLMLLGGIAPAQLIETLVILLTGAFAAGSLANLIALWRERTFQSLALTGLFLILYLLLVHGLSLLALAGVDARLIENVQSWLQPFLALAQTLDPPVDRPAFPAAYVFGLAMVALGALLNLVGMWKLRVWNPSGEPIMQRDSDAAAQEQIDRSKAHAAPGTVREVGANPILWREIRTRAYGRRPLLVKLAYFAVLILVCYYALNITERTDWIAAQGLVPVGILSLLLISAQSVTSITSERDIGALDLLLVTDISPREFIFGKVLGILYNTKEYLLPPLILAGVYAYRGLLASPPHNHPEMLAAKNIGALLFLALGMVVLMAFTLVLGIHVALRTPNSRLAILHTLGAVFFLSIGTLVCIYLILINGRFEYQWLSFAAFLFTGVGGLWWVLSGDKPSTALTLAAWACPVAVFYTITNVIVGRPGQTESTDPIIPFLVTGGAFGFALTAMLVPMISEFDLTIGRTSAIGD
ncbi:MAG: ABC transporter permease [Gemmataceae bacterium]